MDPHGLIRIARHLASGAVGESRGRPRQIELRRAVSAAYYGLFHALAISNANVMAGGNPANRSQDAWRQTYRALEHGFAKNQCMNRSAMSRFSVEIQDFGHHFIVMQDERHRADYDPDERYSRLGVISLIDASEGAIVQFEAANPAVRRAFAVYVLLRNR